MMSWRCSVCTFLNPSPPSSSSSQNPTCRVCRSSAALPSPSLSAQAAPPTKPKWSCKACTFLNPYDSTSCEICGTRVSASLVSSVEVDDDEADGVGSAVGNVFLPLRGCSNGRNKRQVVEIPEGGFDKENETEGLRILETEGFGKVVEYENDNDMKKIDLKGFGNGFPSLKACSSTVVNSEGFDVSGDGFRTLKRKAMDSGGVLQELKVDTKEVETKAGNKPLKIMSYNVWFREEVEMHKRMQAIGDLIRLHSPDIICFQEVTHNIYQAFQRSSWWKLYRCSVSNHLVFTRDYFCMQLSRLPVKSYYCTPFANTIMGRELCVAELNVQKDVSLLVATSHLENPDPAPPTWNQMYSKERVLQANYAINLLSGKNPNVIFCGDMNWNDKLDGPFPLPNGWVDAWVQLRPSENGWTYDTKSNKMLTGQRLLQRRLDRFVCNLQDFEISKIEMIGMEEIPGASYCKDKKVKSVVKKLTLPVLPSDHYGLLLTICLRKGSCSKSG